MMLESNETLLEALPLALIRLVDEVARRAERLYRSGQEIQIESYLLEVPVAAQGALLEELLGLEIEQRLKRGQEVSKDELLNRFPSYSTIVERVLRETKPPAKGSSTEPQAATDAAAGKDSQSGSQHRFPNIPGYKIERQLGRGAMGVVYLARQERLQRLVAVKVVAAGFDTIRAADIVRAEAAVIARLKHPNIVQVYEIGEDEGEPFLAIEYVDGESLREALLKQRLSQRQAVELIEQLARAIHHAHTNGVVHRDLKPANILLLRSGPDLIPKISDFGLAKVLDAMQEQTRSGMVLGTPKYMAPEQAEGRTADIGPATDVYGLGAILFELLAGRAPFETASSLMLMQAISLHEVRFPIATHQSVPIDLQAICLKCLEKEPNRRYSSALGLADDIRRYLDDFPVIARRPTRFDQATKFVRRNPTLSASIATVFATLIAASFGIGTFALRESNARAHAEMMAKKESEARTSVESLRNKERRNVYWANLHLAQKAWQGNRLDDMREHLQQVAPSSANDVDLRGFEWHYLWRLCGPRAIVLSNHHGESKIAFSPDGNFLATPNGHGEVRIFEVESGELQFVLSGHNRVMDLEFSPDGSKLAVGCRDFNVYLWDLSSRELLYRLEGHKHAVRALAFRPNGQQLLTADEVEKVVAWSVNNGEQVWELSRPELHVTDVDFDRAGNRIALGRGYGEIVVVEADSGRELQTIQAHSRWLTGVAFSPDGEQVASCGEDRKAKIFSLKNPEDAIEIEGHDDVLTAVAFSHDGETLGTSSNDGTLRLWDPKTGKERVSLMGHANWVRSIAFSADDTLVASSSTDGTARIWRPNADWEVRELATLGYQITSAVFRSQDNSLIMAGYGGEVVVKDVNSGEALLTFAAHDLPIRKVALSADGSKIVTASDDCTIKVWDARTGQALIELQGHTDRVNAALFISNDQQIVSASQDGSLRVWDAAHGNELRTIPLGTPQLAIALSPDGHLLASTGTTDVEIWDTSSWNKVKLLEGHSFALASLAFSSDSRLLAAGSTDKTISIWDVRTGEEINRVTGHTNVVTCVKFSSDGRRIISSSQDGTVRIWEADSGRELLALKNHSDWVNGVSFDASERIIASCSNDGTVKLIELDRVE